jgi:hypothetical protein
VVGFLLGTGLSAINDYRCSPARVGLMSRVFLLRDMGAIISNLQARLRGRVSVAAYLVTVGAVAGFLVLGVVLPSLPSTQMSVHVDMYSSTSSSIALYLNTLDVSPQVQTSLGGERKDYTFPVPYNSISRIRVDLAEQADVHVLLYSISVTGAGDHEVALFGPSELATWAMYFLTTPAPDANALDVTSTAPGADVDSFQSVSDTSNLPAPLSTLVNDSRNSGDRLAMALWGGAVVAALALLTGRGKRKWLAAGIAVGSASAAALYGAARVSGPLETPVTAIGAAAFFGRSIATNTRTVYAMYGLTLLVAVVLVVADRRLNLLPSKTRVATSPVAAPDAALSAPTRGSVPGWAPWAVAAFTVLIALAAFLPNLNAIVSTARSQQYVPGWDTDNLLAWTAFAARGLTPMKDFWYPYDNDLIFQTGLLSGPIIYFLYEFVGIAGYAWVFWRLSGRRVILSCLAVLGLAMATPLIGEFPRYGFALMISAVFCVVRSTPGPRARLWARVVLAAVVAIAAFIEADLLAYAGAGILAVIVLECAGVIWPPTEDRAQSPGWGEWFVGLGKDLLGPAIAVAASVVVSALRGQLAGLVAFYGRPGTVTAYSGLGLPLFDGLRSLPSLDVVLVWAPAVALGVAVLLRWAGGPSTALLAPVLAASSGVGVVLLTKDAVRPLTQDLALVLLVALLACLVTAIASVLDQPTAGASLSVGIITGLLVAALVASGELTSLRSGIAAAPRSLFADTKAFLQPSGADRAAERQRFSSSHFEQYTSELALGQTIRPLLRGGSSSLYVLGDAPVEYVLLDQRPPWEINVYNTSPIRDQAHVIAWIDQHRPSVVVLDRQNGQLFDGVPNDVRIPLVYQKIITSYEPETTSGPFDVLRRMQSGQQPADGFWLNRLGAVLDLGAIPDAEPAVGPPVPGAPRTPVLQVTTAGPASPGLVSVPISFGGTVVTVQFDASGRRRYEIPVDRLWPWALSHHVALAGPASHGWTATIRAGSMPSSRLY